MRENRYPVLTVTKVVTTVSATVPFTAPLPASREVSSNLDFTPEAAFKVFNLKVVDRNHGAPYLGIGATVSGK